MVWRWGPWLLAAAVLVTRLPFMTRTLYAFDSANFALAVRDFYNVAFHQPHPPGYPLYVWIAKAIDLGLRDPNRSLVLEGIALSVVAVLATTALASEMFGRPAGLLAGLLLTFTVGFWGYGEVAYAYVGLAAEVSTMGLLAHRTIAGNRRWIVPLGLVAGVSAGIRWDGPIFAGLLWVWALWSVGWRQRLLSVLAAAVVVVAWAVPMVALTGGPSAYLTAIQDYLKVWSPQSAYVVGDFQSGEGTQASYNLNFFVNYSRQMLGIGIVSVLYLLGRRFSPVALATDYRSRFLVLWTVPPIFVYVFTHLGEPGYVLSLAPQAATMTAVAALDLGRDFAALAVALRSRGWRWLPCAARWQSAVAGVLVLGVVAWNAQAFLRGVGPGRLPDLRAHDATTGDQVAFLRDQPADRTLVLAHDILRQVQFYLPGYRVDLLYSEYVPNWETVRTRTDLTPGEQEVVVLDSPLTFPTEDAARVREQVLSQQPPVSVWLVDVTGARAVEHGYHYVHVLTS